MNSQQKFRIILAEDDPDIREILAEILEDEGFECTTAVDGQDACQKIQEQSFDLLISDFRMPHMNGVELLHWCRNNKIHFPVIFITANKDLFSEEKIALNDCCAALLQKPIDINNLLKAIEDAKDRNHHAYCEL